MEESYEINYIAVKGGSIKIRYSVSPTGGVPEENIVSISDSRMKIFGEFGANWRISRVVFSRCLWKIRAVDNCRFGLAK